MINSSTAPAPYAAPILRLSLGILFLAHVALMIFVFTIPGFVPLALENAGLDLSRTWGQRLAVHQQGRRLGISGVLGCLPRRLVSAR
jgi:hypothetical protein